MKENPIVRSPYAFDIISNMKKSAKEKESLYSKRVNEAAKTYTVIDVLKNVYHRSFLDDLRSSIKQAPKLLAPLKRSSDEWIMSQYYINSFKIIRPESVFDQPAERFYVDIYAEASFKIIETERSGYGMMNTYPAKTDIRLRYCFDFRPCELTCNYEGAYIGDKQGIYSLFPDSIHMDKYLLPVMKTQEDYEKMAEKIIREDMPEYLDSKDWICGLEWIDNMGLGVHVGEFPEDGVMGEYFFSFGRARVYDPEANSFIEENINPGTILLNRKTCDTRGKINSTATHEGVHHRLGYFFFMLQMSHGGSFASYLCKRNAEQFGRNSKWTPIDIMELQANKLPAYILIQDKPGRAKARELYESYGGKRSLDNTIRLVNDMAEYFGVTKTIARSRLFEFGYREVDGVSQYIKGRRIPAYISDLSKNETYTIDELEAINEYIENPKFRKVLDSGNYEYIEGHYCLCDTKYISTDHLGYKHLTTYAREHMDECCLVFEIKYENMLTAITEGILRKSSSSSKVIKYTNRSGGSLVTSEGLARRREIERQLSEVRLIQKDFNQMTKELMSSKGFTVEKLSEETGLSLETIKNMRNNPDKRLTIESITAVCIAMHLSNETSLAYIDKSPAKFYDTVDMRLYRYALLEWRDNTVAEVNRKLLECGAKPLTTLVAGLDEDVFAMTC